MTNLDVIIKNANTDKHEEMLNKLTNCLANICEKIIYRMNIEQDEHMEVSNFDKADMITDFKAFFNHEIKG